MVEVPTMFRMNFRTAQVYRSMNMRPFTLILLLHLPWQLKAQPLFEALQPDFVFYLYGQHIRGDSLVNRDEITFRADGQKVRPGVIVGTDRAFVRFQTRRAIDQYHEDTLWLEVEYQTQIMRIGFPPRAKASSNERYGTFGLWIDFQPADYMITDLKRVVDLRGIIANLQEIAGNNEYFDLIARCNESAVPVQLDTATGEIKARMLCIPERRAGIDWIDLELEAREWYGHLNNTMKVRLPYGPLVDLQEFAFVPTRFHRPQKELVIDDEVKRDTIIAGNVAGLEVHLHPVNPKPEDTLSIQLRWIGSGAPYVSSHSIIQRPDGANEIRFSFALRTDVEVATDAWEEQARPFRLPRLQPGRYILTQGSITGKDIQDVDLLIGREVPFIVR